MTLGALVALLSAFAFSMNGVLVRRGVTRAPPSQGVLVSLLVGVPLFALAALVTGQLFHLGRLPLTSFGLLGLAGIIHFALGRLFNYHAIAAIGAARTAPLQALQIPYAVAVAYVFLDEAVTVPMLAGIALVLLGPLVILERPNRSARTTAPGGVPTERLRQGKGYLLAALATVAYGTSPILIRGALAGEAGLSVAGGLVSYLAAAAILLASLALPSQRSLQGAFQPRVVRAFFGASVAIFLAQMLRFLALSLASVAVVATLQRANAIFTLLLAWLMNRELEVLTPRLVLGVAISVLGALLVLVGA